MPAAFAFAHRALAAAAILARPALLILRFFLAADFADGFPFAFAHLAFWAAAILARADRLILDFFGDELEFKERLRMEDRSRSNLLILSFKSAARLSCTDVIDDRLLIVGIL